jgi:hypothetical protein
MMLKDIAPGVSQRGKDFNILMALMSSGISSTEELPSVSSFQGNDGQDEKEGGFHLVGYVVIGLPSRSAHPLAGSPRWRTQGAEDPGA